MNKIKPLWTPSPDQINNSNLFLFIAWLNSNNNLNINNYSELYDWSITNNEEFWGSIWDFCQVTGNKGKKTLINPHNFIDSQWFPDSYLNFAENLFRHQDDRTALISRLENGQRTVLSYRQLYQATAKLSAHFRAMGVTEGDRIAAFMPNVNETVIGMLAATSIGAVWTSCSPDFGINSVIDRFGQTLPKILIACDGYYYKGKTIDTLLRVEEIVKKISSIEQLIIVDVINGHPKKQKKPLSNFNSTNTHQFNRLLEKSDATSIEFTRLPFNHPLYIMYSSGTTGKPKCIVHGTGGTLLQHLKEHQLHTNLKPDDCFFYFTSCGWMMWNWLISGLATGATLVLYDGSPFYPKADSLIDMIDEESITVFGTGARYISTLEKAAVNPKASHSFKSLKTILSTGSPLAHESFHYVYREIKTDICLSSISGGTDIVSCFSLGNPTLPVYPGELQCLGLGMAVEIWDENGRAVTEKKGELVCTKTFPSKPVGFWRDPDNKKFISAYFNKYPNVWAHGDYGEITEHGGLIIHGRSDSTLNPGGVRIGTAEIYRQVEKISEVINSVCVGQMWDNDIRVILFVVLKENKVLDNSLQTLIKKTIRDGTTVRHVPDKILQVFDIPTTISGKVSELAVRNTIHGKSTQNADALANPTALEQFKNINELS